MHGRKHAIDAVLAVIANAQSGQVPVFTSDADVARLVDADIVVRPL